MGSIQTFKPTPALIQIPANYPAVPAPGKIEILWAGNTHSLYHRLKPWTDYDQTLINKLVGDKEPFYYIYPDENNKGINALKKYESRLFPKGSAPIDVIRVAKFLGSGRGVTFLSKQFLLQTGNAFNETRIYNATSPIVASGMTLALGTVRPQRHLDISAGLGGIAQSLFGNLGGGLVSGILGGPKVLPPPGTVVGALPDVNSASGGKGLLRADTANRAAGILSSKWPQSKGTSAAGSLGKYVLGVVRTMFNNFIPATQPGLEARGDEGTYGLMIGSVNKFVYIGNSATFEFGQRWVAGGKIIRKNSQYPARPYRVFIDPNGNAVQITNNNLTTLSISNIGQVGYTIAPSGNQNKPGVRYGDTMGKDADLATSDVMVEYKSYVDPTNSFPTKVTKKIQIEDTNAMLKKVIGNIGKASGGIYTISVPQDASLIRSGNSTKSGYDRLFAITQGQDKNRGLSPLNYPLGVLQSYRDGTIVVDNTLTTNKAFSSYKLPTAGNFDAINTLTVLDKNKTIDKSRLAGWDTWQPYRDDIIAFFFYDIVNEKFIPFRATIKGLSESANASWEEIAFVGRADKVYSYSGFNRTLALTFTVVISSLAELAPTWQRINYLSTLVKPSNYTTDTFNHITNRFMVPPMVMLTIGDMYRDQPVLIPSLTMTIPDDASWETMNEDKAALTGQEWSYLSTFIKAPNVLYGQLPRTVDVSLSLILLEKERAVAGGANFGHAPRTDDWKNWNTNTVPNAQQPNKLNQSLVVDVVNKG